MTLQLSIIIPTHNRTEHIHACLHSIYRNAVDKKTFEVIIISDGFSQSTDSCIAGWIAQHPNIRYYRQQQSGPATARNKGLARAQGTIITFIDDDCVVGKKWIYQIIAAHRRYPDDAAIAGSIMPIEKNIVTEFSQSLEARADTKNRDYFYASLINNNSYKRAAIKNLRFNETLRYASGEDVEFNYRFFRQGGKTRFCKDIIVSHHYKKTLHELFAQQFMFGRERWKLMRQAEDYPFRKRPRALYILKRLATPVFDPWLRFEFAIRHHRRFALAYPGIGYLQQFAYWTGFVYGLIHPQ